MINLDKALVEGQFKTKMLLQVHDEIILQVPKDELETVKKLVKETMESAIDLSVPLIADGKVCHLIFRKKCVILKKRHF